MLSNKVEVLAPAKINLFLEVTGRRPDGYHNIETIFQTVSLFDKLTVKPKKNGISLKCNIKGLACDKTNLVVKAALLLQERFGVKKGASIILKKNIPMGAGLGGGSSDAAAALKALVKLWKIKTNKKTLESIASKIGADVGFFLTGGLAKAKGIGDIICPVKQPENVKTTYILLVKPRFGVPTAGVYRSLAFPLTKRQKINRITQSLSKGSSSKVWGKYIFNRLEEVVLPRHPEIESIKSILKTMNIYAMMSGSGSTVFGLVASQREGELIRSKLTEHLWDTWLVKFVP